MFTPLRCRLWQFFSQQFTGWLWGCIMAKFESILWQVKKFRDLFSANTCSPTLIVYCDIISGHTHKQLSCTKPLPQGIFIAINVICNICASEISWLFLHQDILFPLAQLFIRGVGIVNTTFQSAGTGKYTTFTEHLNFHFAPFTVSYKLFPWWNPKHLDFFSIEHKSTLQFFSEGFCMSYFQKKSCQASIMWVNRPTCYPTWCTWLHY